MSLKNTETSYGKMSIILHWLMSVMVIGMVAVGFIVDAMSRGETKDMIVGLHISTGFIVLMLALFRWYWMLSNKKLSPVEGVSKAETGMSHATKWLLMLAIVAMPLSGMLMIMSFGKGVNVYGLFEVPALVSENKYVGRLFVKLHGWGGYAISAVIGLHIAGAIYHHFIKKDDTLNRMLGK